MKRISTILLILCCALPLKAQKEEITKTGLNFGPLPAIAFDADKGFQYGALLQIFNYGNGENYPNYNSKMYMEYSRFTKGSQLIQFRYDDKYLIPKVRWSSAFRAIIDKAYDFYGFNGYATNFDAAQMNPFYRYSRYEYLFKSDFIGKINENLNWMAGLYASYYKLGSINYDNINKGKADADKFPTDMPTLYDAYKASGVISAKEADGGFSSAPAWAWSTTAAIRKALPPGASGRMPTCCSHLSAKRLSTATHSPGGSTSPSSTMTC